MSEDIIFKINQILNRIRGYLNSEGGDVKFLRYEDGVVYVSMLGACLECHSLDFTLKNGIEALICEEIPEVVRVENVVETSN